MALGEMLILGALGLAALLVVARMFCGNTGLRTAFTVVPGLLLLSVILFFVAAFNPGPFAFLFPYESLGRWKTTDVDGTPWDLDVSVKTLSNTIPPGELPRIRLVATSPKGRATLTYDTGWRFGVRTVRPVPGGVELFMTPYSYGLFFQLKGGQWSLARGDILEDTSRWEERVQDVFSVGMSRDEILRHLKPLQSEALPDLEVQSAGVLVTQHSLDREAALYVKYSASGRAESVELKRREKGTLAELRASIGDDGFPLVALIHGAPRLGDADPVGLVRAVNGLRAAGLDRATDALRAYRRLTDPNARNGVYFERDKFDLDEDRLFCILRLLFIPKEGAGAMPLIDMPWIRKPPQGEPDWPLFPISVEDDLPLSVWPRQLGGGSPQDPIIHLDWCLQNARLRDSDLEPKGSPLRAAETLMASDRWKRLFSESERGQQQHFLRRQVRAALEPLLPWPDENSHQGPHWPKWSEDVGKRDPRWDAGSQKFVPGRN